MTPIQDASYVALAAEHVGPCISIYVNGSVGPERAQLITRIKRLFRAAELKLRSVPMSFEDAEQLVDPKLRAIEEGQLLHLGTEGFAMFMSRDFFGLSYLPEQVADHFIVGREFHVRTLLSLMPPDDRFFILALSQKHVKLFEGSRLGIKERTLRDTPENLHEDFEGQSFERQYQLHTSSSPTSGQKGAVFHGPSLGDKDRIAHFLRDVERGVAGALKDRTAPLILATVDYFVPIYREANSYPHLVDETISGNPDQLSADAIHAAAWKILKSENSKAGTRAFSVYTEHMNTPLTSSNLRETLTAAYRGLVRFLFISSSGERWGSLVPPETVHVHDTQEPGDDDLLNLAAILTLRRGGHVYVVPPTHLRQGADVATVFRFALGTQAAGAV
jgi:hypothetical protein